MRRGGTQAAQTGQLTLFEDEASEGSAPPELAIVPGADAADAAVAAASEKDAADDERVAGAVGAADGGDGGAESVAAAAGPAAGATPARAARTRPAVASARPRVPPSPRVTLDEAVPDYVAYLAALGRSGHTLKSFELDLRLLRGQLGNRPVGAIDTAQLRQFIAWVRVSRANTPNSLRRKIATLKNFFGYLRDEGYIPASPADPLPYPEVQMPLPEFLEQDDALRLVEAAEDNPFWRALIATMLDTGLKRDEVLALRVADVHLDDEPARSYLVVRETDAAKRLRSRRLPVPARLRDALRAYYTSAHYTSAHPSMDGDSRVFDISVRGINFIVEECGKRAGIVTSKPRLTPQVLRETFAVAAMRARVEEERRCQMRGWNGEQMQLLTLRHDAEVLGLLGLKEDPDTARKYRQLVKV